MAKKTPEEILKGILNQALEEGWIDQDYAESVLVNHPNIAPKTLIKSIAQEAGLALTRRIEKELERS